MSCQNEQIKVIHPIICETVLIWTYKLNIKNFSSHSLRKTFGRQVFNMSGENSEMALIKLKQIFMHSNMGITKRYLGLKNEEIKETYDLLKF